MKRLFLCCVLVFCLLMPSLFLATPRAYAASLLTCTIGAQVDNYSPGLTHTARATTFAVRESYPLCVDLNAPGLTSGKASFTFPVASAGCDFFAGVVDDYVTYSWNNGQSSSINFSNTVLTRLVDGTTDVTSEGTVTSGFDAGAPAVREILLPELDPVQCDTPQGVTKESGPATLTIG